VFVVITVIFFVGGSKRSALALPNMVAAGAGHRIGWPLFGELLFTDRARFCHHVGHNLGS
jgi:hypothetical protein